MLQTHLRGSSLHFQPSECPLEQALFIYLFVALNCVKLEFSRAVLAHISGHSSHGAPNRKTLRIVYFQCSVLVLHSMCINQLPKRKKPTKVLKLLSNN